MKNILCISLLYCLISSAYAQTITFTKKSERLTEAKGHCIPVFGDAPVDNQNQISHRQETSINSQADNFRWIQMATLSYKGKPYHVLIYQSQGGDYEYPLTEQGWRERTEIGYWIMSSAEYALLKSAVDKKEASDIDIDTYIDKKDFSITTEYDEAQTLRKIEETLGGDPEVETHGNCMVINSLTVDGKDVVRFMLPRTCASTTHRSLKYGYYEVSAADFKKLLID